ncbi:MAG: 3-deoxy-7-phosphoheptulonate synthase [Vicinamibacteria bacterium]|nr:3-deoxy-7-phosphoheptulonate synthase [Vicinamibacteria bacterium]
MLILMKSATTPDAVARVCHSVQELGLVAHPIPGATRVAIGVTGNTGPVDETPIRGLPGVVDVIRVTKPYKLTSREMKPDDTVVEVCGIRIGEQRPVVIAGPCSVETREQTIETAKRVKAAGAHLLRGGAFKPRTSPYAFQGLGEKGLEILAEAREITGLPLVTEVIGVEVFEAVEAVTDILQIGARNMQNYPLLRRAGKSRKPVLLKRGQSATLEEFLLAAEYLLAEGNRNVILCERGIRTFSDHSRYTLDINIVPELKSLTHLPVLVDPSHASGKREMVVPLARAAFAAGADGVIVEVHPYPDRALSDGRQSLNLALFADLMRGLDRYVPEAETAGALVA